MGSLSLGARTGALGRLPETAPWFHPWSLCLGCRKAELGWSVVCWISHIQDELLGFFTDIHILIRDLNSLARAEGKREPSSRDKLNMGHFTSTLCLFPLPDILQNVFCRCVGPQSYLLGQEFIFFSCWNPKAPPSLRRLSTERFLFPQNSFPSCGRWIPALWLREMLSTTHSGCSFLWSVWQSSLTLPGFLKTLQRAVGMRAFSFCVQKLLEDIKRWIKWSINTTEGGH